MVLSVHLLPPSSVNAPLYGSYSYTEQRKVEKDVDRMTGIELTTFQLRRPRTNRLSYVCIRCNNERGVPRF